MNRDQLSIFNSENPVTNFPSEPNSHSDNDSIYVQSISPAATSSVRFRVLERLIAKINEQNLLGRSYVEEYLRYKYRRNCKVSFRQACMNWHKKGVMIGYPAIQQRITDETKKTFNTQPEAQPGQRAV